MFLGGHNRNILGIGLGIPRHEIRVEDEPISSIKTTAEFYNEIRLEEGYTDTQNINPLTNFSDSSKPNATQATPSKQGEYVANDINGHPSILLDGVDDFYDLGDSYQSFFRGNFGITTVIKPNNVSDRQSLLGGRAGTGNGNISLEILDGALRVAYDSGPLFMIYDSDVVFGSIPNNYSIISYFIDFVNNTVHFRHNGTDVNGSLNNGDDIANIDPSTFTTDKNLFIFARNNIGSSERFYNGKSAAPPILVNSLSDLQNAETKLNEKYVIY